jgi:hypothetical protein
MALQISRILHAGYLFEHAGVRIAFDPIVENPFSRNCHAFPQVRFDHAGFAAVKLDAVFISHLHDDHCSLESLDWIDRATPIYLYCLFDELFALIRALGFTQVHGLGIDAPVQVGPFEVIPRRALDADVDAMFHVRADGLNVLNVVDAWMDPETLEQLQSFAPWDMVLWPFQTMREMAVIAPSRAERAPAPVPLPEEWTAQLASLAPRHIVPSSCQFVQEDWSWYNHAMFPITYAYFRQQIETALPHARVLRLNPGVSVRLDADRLVAAAPLDWVIPVGEQDVDFDYRPAAAAAPPTTAQIARRFDDPGAAATALVLDFCRNGLLARYRDMELPEDSYFQAPRVWQLTLYDHRGDATCFRYRLHGDAIEAADDDAGPLAWVSELPLAKCYAALALGESLTSMYLRINDRVFDAQIEEQLLDADLLDDPLIRCLFNDAVGAYQSAQLERIRARRRESI